MKIDASRCRWLVCIGILVVSMIYPNNVCAQESTPAPVRIPDTIPPSPMPPPPSSEAPVPTETPPTTDPPTTDPPTTAPPTMSPTAESTPPPTKTPTEAPVEAPTPSPTISPTADPTADPTSPPTPLPSPVPSWAPSPLPTLFESDFPSEAPSAIFDPTAEPTTSPAPTIPDATKFPSSLPSLAPSTLPSASPSQEPSSLPSSSPTLSLQEDVVEVFMSFDNMQKLEGRSMFTFRSITTQFIEDELETMAEPPMKNLIVSMNVKSQKSVPWTTTTTRRRNIRVLQKVSGLLVVFDTSVQYRSVGTEHDVPALVGGTWETQQDQDAFIAALKSTNDATFQDITAMKTEINGWEPDNDNDNKNGDTDLFIIIGASVGGGLLILLAGVALVHCRRRRAQAKKPVKTSTLTHATPKQTFANDGVRRISTEIIVDHQDDVSTLGDPMFGGGMLIPGLEKDETVAVSSYDDYEYSKTYKAAEGSPMSVSTDSVSKRTGLLSGLERESSLDLGPIGDPFFSDDSSFEEQYQEDGEVLINVTAPAGKLGMVIDTPSSGVPVVHAIKETSVLASQVKVGDRLISVDGEDCTMMSAMQVSKLISERANNPSRFFVFSRSRGRIMSKA